MQYLYEQRGMQTDYKLAIILSDIEGTNGSDWFHISTSMKRQR